MDAWTIFYIGWWVSWAAFVGLFIARISKGRTIASIAVFSYVVPLAYTIMWFSIFGGVGLRQARQAQELKVLGQEGFNNAEHFLAEGSTYCYDVPQEDVVVNGTTLFTNTLIGVTPVCEFNSAEADEAWFNVLYSYTYPLNLSSGFGTTLSWISLFALSIYFITSSDSGSLIVDHLASNGYPETHWTQRVFWAFTEGALATALLVSGGQNGLRAVQAASILSGLPFTLFLCLMCFGAYKMCVLAEKNNKDGTDISLKEEYHSRRVWKMPVYGGVFNFFEYAVSFGIVHEERKLAMPFPTGCQFSQFLLSLVLPFIPYYKVLSAVYPKSESKVSNMIITGVYALMFFAWVILFACQVISPGFVGWAWTAFMINGCILTGLRCESYWSV
jgi:BCCT, betaine/carnitine/choline family transporter